MGLDMYLAKRNGNEYEELIYWRKANAIHGWFNRLAVEKTGKEIEDLADIPVTKEDLGKLLKLCEAVLDNHDIAEAVLPAQRGFFFGSQEYDVWYYKDLARTEQQLRNLLNTVGDDEQMCYYAWW